MTDTNDIEGAGSFAHASFLGNPDLAAEREADLRPVHDERNGVRPSIHLQLRDMAAQESMSVRTFTLAEIFWIN